MKGPRLFLDTADLWETAKRLADREAVGASSTSPTCMPIPPTDAADAKIGMDEVPVGVPGPMTSMNVRWSRRTEGRYRHGAGCRKSPRVKAIRGVREKGDPLAVGNLEDERQQFLFQYLINLKQAT